MLKGSRRMRPRQLRRLIPDHPFLMKVGLEPLRGVQIVLVNQRQVSGAERFTVA